MRVLRRRWLWAAAGLGLTACTSPSPAARPRSRDRPDKAELFADPTLVPTRQGERARRELAKAGEIERAVAVLPAVRQVRVDVESRDDGSIRAVLVVAQIEPERSPERAETAISSIVETVVGDAVTTRFLVDAAGEPVEDRRPSAGLSLAILALGVSLGISYERIRRVLARPRRASRSRAT